MKPIEPGCLALLVNVKPEVFELVGSTVDVIAGPFDGVGCGFCGSSKSNWRVSGVDGFSTLEFPRGVFACGCQLLRIDGDPDEQGIVQIYDEDVTA